MGKKVAIIVLTYNQKKLLEETETIDFAAMFEIGPPSGRSDVFKLFKKMFLAAEVVSSPKDLVEKVHSLVEGQLARGSGGS